LLVLIIISIASTDAQVSNVREILGRAIGAHADSAATQRGSASTAVQAGRGYRERRRAATGVSGLLSLKLSLSAARIDAEIQRLNAVVRSSRECSGSFKKEASVDPSLFAASCEVGPVSTFGEKDCVGSSVGVAGPSRKVPNACTGSLNRCTKGHNALAINDFIEMLKR
jgi:hypothetical protein